MRLEIIHPVGNPKGNDEINRGHPLLSVRATLGALLLLVATTACGEAAVDQEEVAATPNGNSVEPSVSDGTTSRAMPDEPFPAGGKPKKLAPSSGMSNESVQTWRSYSQSSENVEVEFAGGDPKCFGYRAVLDEQEDVVSVAIVEGTLAEAPDVCESSATIYSIDVELDKPLGSRLVKQLSEEKVDLRP